MLVVGEMDLEVVPGDVGLLSSRFKYGFNA